MPAATTFQALMPTRWQIWAISSTRPTFTARKVFSRECWKKNLASVMLLRIGESRGMSWRKAPEAGKGCFFGDHVHEQVLDEGRPPHDPDARRVHKGRRRKVWQRLAQSPGYQQATS